MLQDSKLWKQKAGLMALGSVFTIIGMLFTIRMFPPVAVQPRSRHRETNSALLSVLV